MVDWFLGCQPTGRSHPFLAVSQKVDHTLSWLSANRQTTLFLGCQPTSRPQPFLAVSQQIDHTFLTFSTITFASWKDLKHSLLNQSNLDLISVINDQFSVITPPLVRPFFCLKKFKKKKKSQIAVFRSQRFTIQNFIVENCIF